jgi:hypothetical protein
MAHFYEVTEHSLRDLSSRAVALCRGSHPEGPCSPTDAVIKVASSFSDAQLTNEHIKRICEMTYHGIFEQRFQDSTGGDRMIAFDPPDAEKAASALRVRRLDSFAKAASASPGRVETGMNKNADAPRRLGPPALTNAFSAAMGTFKADETAMRKEALSTLRHLHGQLKEATASLQVEVSTADSSEKVAFLDLLDGAVHATRQGATATEVTSVCLELAKRAGVDDELVLSGLATDLLRGLDQRGVLQRGEKVASLSGLSANTRHPLCAKVEKVASLRGYKLHGEIALQDLRQQMHRVDQEMKDGRYR